MKAHKPVFCSDCLSSTHEYHNARKLFARYNGKWEHTGIYQCDNCLTVFVDKPKYANLRNAGKHIIQSAEGKLE